jgi:hypothetical protein
VALYLPCFSGIFSHAIHDTIRDKGEKQAESFSMAGICRRDASIDTRIGTLLIEALAAIGAFRDCWRYNWRKNGILALFIYKEGNYRRPRG